MSNYGDTPKHNVPALCTTCRAAQIVQGQRWSESVTLCRSSGMNEGARITMHVVKCSSYDDKRIPSLYRLQEIAWDIVDKGNRKIGFCSPDERKAKSGNNGPDSPLLAPWER